MSDPDYLRWIATYGPYVVMVINALSCLGAPIPALVVMLAAGAWAARSGDALWPYLVFGYVRAVVPGLVVFALGKRYGPNAVARLEGRRGWRRLISRAREIEARWGRAAIFLASSFAAQIGPAVNLIAGAAGMAWRKFHPGHLAGRAVWVGGYTCLGYIFADSLAAVTQIAARGSTVVLTAVVIAVAFGIWRVLRRST